MKIAPPPNTISEFKRANMNFQHLLSYLHGDREVFLTNLLEGKENPFLGILVQDDDHPLHIPPGAVPAIADWEGGFLVPRPKISMQSGCHTQLKVFLEFPHPLT